jgi:hypothetical protein
MRRRRATKSALPKKLRDKAFRTLYLSMVILNIQINELTRWSKLRIAIMKSGSKKLNKKQTSRKRGVKCHQ